MVIRFLSFSQREPVTTTTSDPISSPGGMSDQPGSSQHSPNFDPTIITRPVPALMVYYALVSLFTLIAAPIVILPLYFKYETLRYRFDNDGLSVSWGLLFRREVYLTYRRIQDIHLTRNLLQRWMGLATISIQTASGSATPETSIEGIYEAEELRDYLYGKMRGGHLELTEPSSATTSSHDEVLGLLTDIRNNLQRLTERAKASS